MIGETISHYRIVGEVGAGGMGEVYRAHDPRLGRDVAIKILPGAASRDPISIERFQREARAAGALNHPNVLAIFDVGAHNGVPYIVTELLEGWSLRERLVAGDLTRQTAIQVATQIAKGLAAAHARGIIHRDLKPANVFITRDRNVKILDFGLAKLMQDVDPATAEGTEAPTASVETEALLTAAGVVVGTPGYMAPEVLNGASADHRSDIFSLGVIMYELLSGRHPFRRSSRPDMQAAVLRDDPEPLDETLPPVSPVLERIVLRCLEKRPEDRFESAHDLAIALQAVTQESDWRPPRPRPPRWRKPVWLAIGAAVIVIAVATKWMISNRRALVTLPDVRRIAVLPFEAEGEDSELKYLAAGLSMTVLDGLALIEDDEPGRLWVMWAGSEGERGPPDLNRFRRENNVNLAIAGVLRFDDERYQLRLSVLDAQTGDELRFESIETLVGNITTFQDEPTARVSEMLGFTVGPRLRDRQQLGNTNVRPAYLSYLKGRGALVASARDEETDRAIALLHESVTADPLFVPARVALAVAILQGFELSNDPASLEEGLRHVEAAVNSGHASPEAYLALGSLLEAAGRKEGSLRALRQAIGIAPNRAEAHLELGEALRRQQRYEEAEASFERVVNLRPSWWYGFHRMAWLFVDAGEYDAAANRFRRVTELAPENSAGVNNLGTLYYLLKRRDDAQELFLRSNRIGPNADAYSNLGTLAFEDARFGDAVGYFEQAVELVVEPAPEQYGLWGNLASAYFWSGDREEAVAAFRRALELGEQLLDPLPIDPDLPAVLAGYCGMMGDNARGLELIEIAIAVHPEHEESMATIAESLEDLGERDRALEWMERALASGLAPTWVDRRPGLRELVSDPRYQTIIKVNDEQTGAAGS